MKMNNNNKRKTKEKLIKASNFFPLFYFCCFCQFPPLSMYFSIAHPRYIFGLKTRSFKQISIRMFTNTLLFEYSACICELNVVFTLNRNKKKTFSRFLFFRIYSFLLVIFTNFLVLVF